MAEIDDYLAEAAQVVDAAGEGDLTRRMSVEVPSETLAQLSEEFNEMADAFEQTIETAAGFSEEVAGSSEQVTTATEAVKDASERVAGNIQEIADVFHEQHEQISQISDEMSEMSATIEGDRRLQQRGLGDGRQDGTPHRGGIEAGREAHEGDGRLLGADRRRRRDRRGTERPDGRGGPHRRPHRQHRRTDEHPSR